MGSLLAFFIIFSALGVDRESEFYFERYLENLDQSILCLGKRVETLISCGEKDNPDNYFLFKMNENPKNIKSSLVSLAQSFSKKEIECSYQKNYNNQCFENGYFGIIVGNRVEVFYFKEGEREILLEE